MTRTPELWDPGLQPERTLLAWRRTCLALAVGLAVGVRLSLDALGVTTVMVGLAALGLVAAGWFAASHRYRRDLRDLDHAAATLRRGGAPMVATAAAAVLFAGIGGAGVIYWGVSG